MATGRDELWVPDRDPGDPIDGDRPLIVSEGIRRRATGPAERLVEAGDDRGTVRSQVGMTTRNLDQASQAHHSSGGAE